MRACGGKSAVEVYAAIQQKRRAEVLKKQKAARQQQQQAARLTRISTVSEEESTFDHVVQTHEIAGIEQDGDVSWALQAHAMQELDEEIHDEEMLTEAAAKPRSSSGRSRPAWHDTDGQHPKLYFARQLMQPEWMTDVPPDLGLYWLVTPRPEGSRCLLISSRGRTTSRLRNGGLLHTFTSPLPEGSGATRASSGDFCMLDCIFHEPNRTYYMQDLLCWRGYDLTECQAEFRLFWLLTKLQEEGLGEVVDCWGPYGEPFRLVLQPSYPCNSEGLESAYQGPIDYIRDGLYFRHKEGHYSPGATSPLALLWKDAVCSRYLLDTDAQGVALEEQQITLTYQEDGTVATADEPPVVLGRMPQPFVEHSGDKLRPGRLLKFKVRQGVFHLVRGKLVAAGLQYLGPGNQRRGRADQLSKVMFQYMARTHALALKQLLDASSHPTESMDNEQHAEGAEDGQDGARDEEMSQQSAVPEVIVYNHI